MGGLEFKDLAVIVNAIANLAIGAWLYLDRKGDRTNTRIDAIGSRVEALDGHITDKLERQGDRIAHLEAHVEEAPTHGDLGDLYEKVGLVDSKVSAQGGTLDAISGTVRMILQRITEKGMP